MKRITVALLLSFSTVSFADVLTQKTPVCMSVKNIDQANIAKERGDTRGLGYLVKEGDCFFLTPGMEYSLTDVNYQKEHKQWAKIRVYTQSGAVEVYTWYGFVR